MDFCSFKKLFSGYRAGLLHQSLPDNAPAFMIIGAQKAGTTALYSYLSQHPGIAASPAKELHFFNCEKKYLLGIDFYHSLFPSVGKNQLTFDASPSYLCHLNASKRIFAYNRKIKIIVLLRDPVERAYSAWNMYAKLYKRNKNWFYDEWLANCDTSKSKYVKRSELAIFDFKDYILEEFEVQQISPSAIIEAPVILHGYYYDQLSRLYSYFPEKQILIIENSELRKNSVSILQRIEKFLGLSGNDWSKANLSPVFEGDYCGAHPDEGTFRILSKHYAPHTEKLFNFLGVHYSWYSYRNF